MKFGHRFRPWAAFAGWASIGVCVYTAAVAALAWWIGPASLSDVIVRTPLILLFNMAIALCFIGLAIGLEIAYTWLRAIWERRKSD